MSIIIPKIFEELHKEKKLTDDEYSFVLKEVNTKASNPYFTLFSIDLLNEDEVISTISKDICIPYVQLKDYSLDTLTKEYIQAKYAFHYMFVPLKVYEDSIDIAISNPLELQIIDEIKVILNKNINVFLSGKRQIRETIKKIYGIGADTVEQMIDHNENSISDFEQQTENNVENLNEEASIIKFVNQILTEAVRERATDIHIEPYKKELKIRYRIDGVLYDAPFPTTIKHFHSPIISRIKIMADLNISERRMPQDGRIKIKLKTNDLDLRVSILPSPWGEAASF